MSIPLPTLFLHVGSHKTGTTALQTFSVTNRELLRRHGLLYPDFSPFLSGPANGHHAWAHAFSASPRSLSRSQACELLSTWREVALQQQLSVVVSAEALYRHVLGQGSFLDKRRHYLQVVRDALTGFNVVPVLVLRRPDDYVRSLYQEAVALRSVPRRLPGFSVYLKKRPSGVDYFDNAMVIEQVFGTVKVLCYEDLAASTSSLAEAFYSALGYPLSGETCVTDIVRASLSAEETLVKNEFNDLLETRADSKHFISMMRTAPMQALLRHEYPDPPYSLWPGAAARLAFFESRERDLDALRQRYFPDRLELFRPPQQASSVVTAAPPSKSLLEQLRACLPANRSAI